MKSPHFWSSVSPALVSALLVGASFIPHFGVAGPKDPLPNYNEVFRPDGTVRLHYQGIYETYQKLSPSKRKELLRKSKKLFSGDNQLNLLPRVLTQPEADELKAGVKQRATALKMFFADHYSGKKTYLENSRLKPEFVNQIIARHGDQAWEGRVTPEVVNWLYGPDILRLPNGKFAIVEDNFGSLGGLGDLEKAPQALFELIPEYSKHLEVPNPVLFYQRLANRYKERAKPFGSEKVVLLQHIDKYQDDKEGKRLTKLMDRFEVETVTFDYTTGRPANTAKTLVVKEDGVYLVTKAAKRTKRPRLEKIGYVFIQGEITDIDSKSPGVRRIRLIKVFNDYLDQFKAKADPRVSAMILANSLGKPFDLEDAERLYEETVKKQWNHYYAKTDDAGVPGLLTAILKGKVGGNYTPGLGFVEDKEFYIAVPELIRYYLHQEPILENIETGSFRTFDHHVAKFDEAAFANVFKNLDQYVIKGVSGMGGAEVWIGPKLDKKGIEDLKVMVRENPSLFIFQKYLPLSQMEGDLVDLRFMADVGPKTGDVLLAEAPWGRASPMKGSGKVNISSGGSETSVFIRNNIDLNCQQNLH